MSILIKGITMPKSGTYRCVVRKWKDEITLDLYGDEELGGALVELPPHGRLIDADAAMKQGWVIQRNYRKTLTDSVVEIRHITELPTIIEAEEVSDE